MDVSLQIVGMFKQRMLEIKVARGACFASQLPKREAICIAGRIAYGGMPAAYNMGMEITLTELEEAINYWRTLRPSRGEERALSPEVNALATDYALMIFYGIKTISADRLHPQSVQLLQAWRAQA